MNGKIGRELSWHKRRYHFAGISLGRLKENRKYLRRDRQ
jgi:hypothetical protein